MLMNETSGLKKHLSLQKTAKTRFISKVLHDFLNLKSLNILRFICKGFVCKSVKVILNYF